MWVTKQRHGAGGDEASGPSQGRDAGTYQSKLMVATGGGGSLSPSPRSTVIEDGARSNAGRRCHAESWHAKVALKLKRQKQEIRRLGENVAWLRIQANELTEEERIIVHSHRVHRADVAALRMPVHHAAEANQQMLEAGMKEPSAYTAHRSLHRKRNKVQHDHLVDRSAADGTENGSSLSSRGGDDMPKKKPAAESKDHQVSVTCETQGSNSFFIGDEDEDESERYAFFEEKIRSLEERNCQLSLEGNQAVMQRDLLAVEVERLERELEAGHESASEMTDEDAIFDDGNMQNIYGSDLEQHGGDRWSTQKQDVEKEVSVHSGDTQGPMILGRARIDEVKYGSQTSGVLAYTGPIKHGDDSRATNDIEAEQGEVEEKISVEVERGCRRKGKGSGLFMLQKEATPVSEFVVGSETDVAKADNQSESEDHCGPCANIAGGDCGTEIFLYIRSRVLEGYTIEEAIEQHKHRHN